jgi:hypothetical protein
LKSPFVKGWETPLSFEIAEARWWLLLRSALCATPNYLPAPPAVFPAAYCSSEYGRSQL